ncbi:TetR/AcrR family transcriptional regulator [Sandaracinobacteroides saxicola]|uniref:TetR/AcrR family transcriptional regulator n=1 Tax=Sandaracinobacteroides saxicola TaxID=2759707 RepID=A0A7G5IKI6_9SPHN|nr:TetR/AcrR family transcriptional regulator [Sandaracinobacteroides saxicola]QMW23878.1 TetR/AcrR family transcriptional regulator [Sandaracinobacteroides saxicola]
MPRPRSAEHEAARRAHILRAAAACFRQRGLHGATMASICKAAGIGTGALYHWFPSKEALIEAMAETDLALIRGFAERLHSFEDLIQSAIGPPAASDHNSGLGNVGGLGPELLLAGPLAFDLFAEASRNPRIHAILHAHYSGVRATFIARIAAARARGDIAADVEPAALGILIGSLREGLGVIATIEPAFIDDAMHRLARAMLESVAHRPVNAMSPDTLPSRNVEAP